MTFTDCHYADAGQTTIIAWRDGVELSIPAVAESPLYNDVLQSGVAIAAYVPPPVDLIAHLRARRYEAVIGGVTVSGMTIATDTESRGLIDGAYAMALRDPDRTFNWQAEAGFVTLSAAQIIAIAVAVGDHVQACFDFQAATAASIADGTITTVAEIDALDWPA